MDVVERARLEDEEAAVDPALELRLLLEALHDALAVQARHAELELRLDHGHGGQRAVAGVEVEQGVEVDVGHPVGVGGAEAAVLDAVAHARDAAAGGRVLAGLDALDGDVLGEAVVSHEVLDQLAPVAEAEHEAVEALVGVDPDDVPEDRPAADLHQRLRDRLGVLAQARAAAAAQDHDRLVHRRERYRPAGAAPVGEQDTRLRSSTWPRAPRNSRRALPGLRTMRRAALMSSRPQTIVEWPPWSA